MSYIPKGQRTLTGTGVPGKLLSLLEGTGVQLGDRRVALRAAGLLAALTMFLSLLVKRR